MKLNTQRTRTWIAAASLLAVLGAAAACSRTERKAEEAHEATPSEQSEAPAAPDMAAPATAAPGMAMQGSMPPPPSNDVVTTASGLKYIEIEAGGGASPQAGQTVSVHYTGWLADGTKFDSSRDRGQPIEFVLGRGMVIQGWDEGLSTMKVGGQRRLIIPPDLAYGPGGRPPVIPPNAELTFDVELVGAR